MITIRKVVASNNGLTLIELMIVLVLSLLLMSAVYLAYQIQHKTSRVQFQVTQVQQDLRAVMEIITTDIRHAGVDPTFTQSIVGIPSNESGSNFLRIAMDIDEDGSISAPGEDISYRLNGTNLERFDHISNTLQVLAQNVTMFALSYFGETGTGTIYQIVPTGSTNPPFEPGNTLSASEASEVRFIEVRLDMRTAQVDPDTGNFLDRTLTRRVCRRN
ncbi:MAG TPA: prepilin-type N-terminal cleavage/methylation domain-containing protein [Deltaproteobacteria bacterium]|nr:prepilin-type N-terminal cleavage/methylation domain-containing protein [Deltaproteobacteria bacterium]